MAAKTTKSPKQLKHSAADQKKSANTTVRVSVDLLDNLMTMMSEMILVRNQILQISNRSDDQEFLNLSQRLDVATSKLQSEVMKTRMQPIGHVLSKFQRLTRDLAKELNKKIKLILEGTETELDKSLIEAIKDPLTHIIRNACDHGLETTKECRAVGKPEHGQILVRSFHEDGQVVIQITDNGRGLNRDKLIKKALEKGIITQEKSAKMTDREAHELIFAAGFSTAANVTNISGRGVGMDVVKNNIEKIGGRVELKSEFGKGMTISLKIPLMLATTSEKKYAIPQVKLVNLVHIENSSDSDSVMINEDDLKEFRQEGAELLEVAEKALLSLEDGADYKTQYNAIFRVLHNLKGAAGMMKMLDLQAYAHVLETELVSQKEKDSLTSDQIDYFLKSVDTAKKMLCGENS